MNFRTESFDLPQNEQRRCLSLDIRWPSGQVSQRGPGTLRSWVPGPGASRLAAVDRREVDLPLDHVVDEAVHLGLLGAHEPVPVHVPLDDAEGLRGVLGVQLVHLAAEVEDLLGLDLDVRRRARGAAGRLVDHDARVRQGAPLAGPPRGQQERSHRRGHPHSDGVDRRFEELDRVVDRHPARYHSARRVDIEVDVPLGVVRLEEEQLRDDDVGDVVVDRRAEEDDPVHQQAREDVVRALAPAGPFDDVRRIQRRHAHALASVTVDWERSHVNAFSSVSARSRSRSRPAFSSEAYSWAGGAFRAFAISLTRASMSASLAASLFASTTASRTTPPRPCAAATVSDSAPQVWNWSLW